jgi:hypothetical protein
VLAFRDALGHLEGEFGPMPRFDPPRDVAGYTRAALSGDVLQWPDGSPRPASAKTMQLHLNVLHDLFKALALNYVA